MNHSPAPWNAERDANGELTCWNEDGDHLLHSDSTVPLKIRRANAQLMIASPLTYGALVCALADIEALGHVGPKTIQQMKDAVAEADKPIPGEDWDADDETEDDEEIIA